MGDGAELRNAAKIIAPYSGWVSYLYTSGAAASQDLSKCGAQQPIADNNDAATVPFTPGPDILAPIEGRGVNSSYQGLMGRYGRFFAYNATIWVVMGPTSASVTTANAPVIASGSSSTVNTAGNAFPIVQGTYMDLFITVSTCFCGFIGSGAGFLIVCPSSVGANG